MSEKTPIEEITKRTAEVLPGMVAGAKAVGLMNHMQSLKDHRQRVMDSHRIQMKALGMEPSQPANPEAGEDEMGDQIFICGDITQAQPAAGGGQQPVAEKMAILPAETPPSTSGVLKKVAAGAALVAGGAAIPLATQAIQSLQPPTVVVEQTPAAPAPPLQQAKPFDPNDYELRLVPEQ